MTTRHVHRLCGGLLATVALAFGIVASYGPSVAVVGAAAAAIGGCSAEECAELQAGYDKVNATIDKARDKLDACPVPFGPTCKELQAVLDSKLIPLREQFKLWLSIAGCEISFARVAGEPEDTPRELRRKTKRAVAEAEELIEALAGGE